MPAATPTEFPALARLVPGALLHVAGGRVLAAGGGAGALFAVPADELVRRRLAELLPDGAAALERAAASGARERARAMRATGVPVMVDVSAQPAPGGGQVLLVQELGPQQLSHEADRLFGPLFETSPVGMALFDNDGHYVRVNAALCKFLDRAEDDLLGRRDQELTHTDDRASDVAAAWRILRGELDCWQTEKRFVRPDGSVVWAIANLTYLRDDDRRPLCWVGVFQDITERKRLEEELRREADHDPLTGLVNVRRLREELTRALRVARQDGTPGALLVVDLDGFKAVNDTHGHRAGDEVLVGVARAMRARLRATDVLARVGGDEFAVLLPRVTPAQAAAVARDLGAVVDGAGA